MAQDHITRFVLGLFRDEVDLALITGTYGSEKGQPPYHPVMMVALLLHAYTQGIYASRRIEKACGERVNFMAIVGLDAPNFRTIADFRKHYPKALEALFMQIPLQCAKAGRVKLGQVAIDGAKIKTNASMHEAMSYERMEQPAAELEAEVAHWLAEAKAADAEDDKQHGLNRSGVEMLDWVADKEMRADRIRKAELEAEARSAAEAKARAKGEAEAKEREQKAGDRDQPEPAGSPC